MEPQRRAFHAGLATGGSTDRPCLRLFYPDGNEQKELISIFSLGYEIATKRLGRRALEIPGDSLKLAAGDVR
jgi:hypothetical protein